MSSSCEAAFSLVSHVYICMCINVLKLTTTSPWLSSPRRISPVLAATHHVAVSRLLSAAPTTTTVG